MSAVHPYRLHLHTASQELLGVDSLSNNNNNDSNIQSVKGPNMVQKFTRDTPSPSTCSGNTFHSAQTFATKDSNDTVVNNNTVEYSDYQNTTLKETASPLQTQPLNVYIPPLPTLQSTNLPSPRSNLQSDLADTTPSPSEAHYRSSSSLSGRIPDTPVGTRSFSLPVLQHAKSSENLIASRSQSPSSNPNEYSSRKSHDRMSKSVDLSHLYLLDRNESTHFTLTNESLSDVSHNLIKQYLGENSSSSLLPRMKTIEMYRKNVKKSNDPKVLFQYAQYMLQTALSIDANTSIGNGDENLEKDVKKQFLKEAVHYLKKLADKGYTDAQYLLGDAYSSGALGKIDNKEAFVLFQGAAKHGHVESAYRTAYCYEEGLGTSRDSRRAIEFLKYAASKNHPAAMYKLGVYSFYSKMGLADNVYVKKNGIQWLSRAVTRANELTNAAPYELAKIYENGFLDIIIPDQKYAMELYVQAASLGHTKSAAILGKAYEFGNDIVSQDSDLSIHYYTQAALAGDPESMLSLCAWYLVGNPPNLPKDESEAFQWALKAANLNLPKAQFGVGHFYEKGIGCEQNLALAREWFKKADDNGDEKAKNRLLKLGNGSPATNNQSGLSATSQPSSKKLSPKQSSASLATDKKLKKKKSKILNKKDKGCIIM